MEEMRHDRHGADLHMVVGDQLGLLRAASSPRKSWKRCGANRANVWQLAAAACHIVMSTLEKLGIGPTLRWDVHGRERSGSAGRPGVRRLLPATAAIAVRVWACKKIEFPKIRLCPRRLYGCCT